MSHQPPAHDRAALAHADTMMAPAEAFTQAPTTALPAATMALPSVSAPTAALPAMPAPARRSKAPAITMPAVCAASMVPPPPALPRSMAPPPPPSMAPPPPVPRWRGLALAVLANLALAGVVTTVVLVAC